MAELNILELAKWTVEQARKAGAEQAAVGVSKTREVEVEYRRQQLETLKETTGRTLSLDVYVDHRFLSSTTHDVKPESIKTLIAEAVAGARYLPADEHRALPEARYYPKQACGDLKIDDPAYGRVTMDERKRLAAETERIAAAQSDKVISATCGCWDVRREVALADSGGFAGTYPATAFGLFAEVSVDGAGRGRPRGGDSARTRYKADLPDCETVAQEAVRRGLARVGQEKIESCRCDMIVENRVAGGRLLGMLLGPAQARALQQKQSFLDGMIGRRVASERLTLVDDPLLEKGLGSRPFDGEGLAARPVMMIEKGVLKHYYVDNYYGRKLGMGLTTGGSSNTVIAAGEQSLEQLIAGCQRAILVTDFIGGNSNSTTGDFSIGIVGTLIENGRLTRPVCEMNIAGNALELWSRLAEVGSDPFVYSSSRTPSLLFKDVAFSGK